MHEAHARVMVKLLKNLILTLVTCREGNVKFLTFTEKNVYRVLFNLHLFISYNIYECYGVDL